jgi:hypothetical protein
MERSEILTAMAELKLYGMKAAFDEIIGTAVKRQHEPTRIVGDLLTAEITEKQARSIRYQIGIAKLPLAKDLDDFSFDDTPINETLVRDPVGGNFLAHQRNVVLVGGTGTGKTHAIAIARACALDGSETPTTIYAGTDFGVLRSVDGGANWNVLDDIHFPRAPVFDLAFHNGELRAAMFGRGVFAFVKPSGPAIAVGLQDNLAFGTVYQGSTHFLTIEVSTVGATDLVITSVQRLMGSVGERRSAGDGGSASVSTGGLDK